MATKRPAGVGIYTEELIKNLGILLKTAEIDFDVYAYSKDRIDEKINDINIWKPVDSIFRKFVSVHRLMWNLFYLPFIAKKYDLIYSFSSHGSPFVKNQIITIHDLICLNFPYQHPFQYFYFKFLLPYIVKSSYKVVVISEFTKKEVLKYYDISEDKIIVNYNGADHFDAHISDSGTHEEKISELTAGRKFFLTVGASYEHKNIERLIDAIALIQTDAVFIIVGTDNKYCARLKAKLLSLQVQNVTILNYVSRDFLCFLYSKSICNIYVSLYEGFGFTPIEAASFNTLSIVSNVASLPEIYGNSVIYTNPYDVDDIAEKIKSVEQGSVNVSSVKSTFPVLLNKYKWSKSAAQTFEDIQVYLNTENANG